MEVDLEALQTMAIALDNEGRTIAGLKTAEAFDTAEEAMSGSQVGAALARAGRPLDTSYRAMSNCLYRMAEAMAHSVVSYEEALELFVAQVEAVGSDFENEVR
ncbi:MAG: hypothetical protein GXY65_01570 [Rhodococcus sp.]|uniref:hypothetical protein n=1 Tax=Rhodococcus TaxID=1827 RepID=UPI0016956B34|nr:MULTISPECIES: hypothetical protein [Rhodococcus]NLV78032.1 hypothetical protein [Rhodococcus sp. (in: high G+C Gram-positive bacteria)]